MVLTLVQVVWDAQPATCRVASDVCEEISTFLVEFGLVTLSQLVAHGSLALFQFVVENDCQQLQRYKRCFGRHEIFDALCEACQKSDFHFVVQVTNQFGVGQQQLLANQHRAVDLACAQGNLEILKFLFQVFYGTGTGTGTRLSRSFGTHGGAQPMDLAAQKGHLHVVKFLHKLFPWKNACCSRNAMDFASENGHLPVVQFLHRHRVEGCTKRALDLACQNGCLHIVQFLHANRSEGCTVEGPKQACANGYLSVIKYFVAKQMSFCFWCCVQAALQGGYLLIAQWLDQEYQKQLVQMQTQPVNLEKVSTLRPEESTSTPPEFDSDVTWDETNDAGTASAKKKPFSAQICEEIHVLKLRKRGKVAHSKGKAEMRRFFREVVEKGGLTALKWIHERFGACASTKKSADESRHNSNISKTHRKSRKQTSVPARDHAAEMKTPSHGLTFGSEVMAVCVEQGSVSLAKWLVEEMHLEFTNDHLQEAASKGHLNLFKHLLGNQCATLNKHKYSFAGNKIPRLPRLLEGAAANGHLKVCEFLMLEKGFRLSRLDPVVVYGKISLLQFVYDRQKDHFEMTCSQEALNTAAIHGHLPVVEFIYEKKLQRCSPFALVDVCEDGLLEMVAFLLIHEKETILMMQDELTRALGCAIVNGHLAVVETLMQFMRECLDYSLDTASVDDGEPTVRHQSMQSLRSVLIPAINDAASRGFFHVVQFLLKETGIKQGVRLVIENAIIRGDLPMIRCLHELGVQEFMPQDMDEAAARGFFRIVEFLHRNRHEGCTVHAMDAACCHGYLGIVEFLHHNRQEGCTAAAMDGAAHNGHLRVVRFLHENRSEGCTCEAMDQAARFGDLELVHFLHVNRSEGCTTRAMDAAASNGCLDVVKYLHFHRNEGCTSAALVNAAANGHYEVVKWLLLHRPGEMDLDTSIRMACNKPIGRLLERVMEGKPVTRPPPPPARPASFVPSSRRGRSRGTQQFNQHSDQQRSGLKDHRPQIPPPPFAPSVHPQATHICFPDAA